MRAWHAQTRLGMPRVVVIHSGTAMPETPTQTPARLFSPLTAALLPIGVVGLIAQLVLFGVDWQAGKGYGFAMLSLFLPMAFWAAAGVGALVLVFYTFQTKLTRGQRWLNIFTIAVVVAGIITMALNAPAMLGLIGE